MSEGSSIGWLHRPGHKPMTGNVVVGCIPRSTGCLLCYAPRSVVRQAHLDGRGGIVIKTGNGLEWTGVVKMFPERVAAFRKLTKPHMIFVTALGELFDPQVTMEFLTELWATMAATPHHTYIILTKLPGRMYRIVSRMVEQFGVLPNVWLGVSTENQKMAAHRLPWLERTPAAVKLVSVEPMLGPVDLSAWLPWLSWVIVGGESGTRAKARAMHPEWARNLVAQTFRAGVACFFKQWGSWGPAPWMVRVCDPAEGWHGTDTELAAAKTAAEKIGATHLLPVWADQYDMLPRDVGHKCWSLERRPLPAGGPHAPLRYYPGKSAGHVLDDRTWQQWPDGAGGIIDVSERVDADGRRELVAAGDDGGSR